MKTFTDTISDYKTLSRDNSSSNETLGKSLVNQFIRKILVARDWVFNRDSYADKSVADQQNYPLPVNCWRVRSIKVTVGTLNYFPKEVTSREVWTNLNRTVVTSDAATRFFVEKDHIELYPVPATDDNDITIYFQKLIKELGATDYSTGNMTVTTPHTTQVVGSVSPATVWVAAMIGRYLKPTDDGFFYEIGSVTSPTMLDTKREVRMSIAAGDYEIAELIPLPFGYEDIPLWRALFIYFQKKEGGIAQAREYKTMYEEGLMDLLRRDAKTTGNVITKKELQGLDLGLIDINKYPTDMS